MSASGAGDGAARPVAAEAAALQRSADSVLPRPAKAIDDRGRAFREGCHLKNSRKTTSPSCVYGNPRSDTTVVLMGDSHGLQWFPAMHALAKQRGWRLISLTRAGCTSASVRYAKRCDAWRRNSLQRIKREKADLVVFSNGTSSKYRITRKGRTLSRRASQPALVRGFAKTLRRVRAAGAEAAVIRDQSFAPKDVVACVKRNMRRLGRCAFPVKRSKANAFDARAARKVDGVRLIDPVKHLCSGGRCPAVIDSKLVYRNDYHLSATFSASMAGWIGERLPPV